MAVTPNYSWPVPVNTDYVKDGAEAIKDLGDAIDSTVFGLPAGALALISSQTLTTSASFTFQNVFSATYDNYFVTWQGVSSPTSITNLNFDVANGGTRANTSQWARIQVTMDPNIVTNAAENQTSIPTAALGNQSTSATFQIFKPFLAKTTDLLVNSYEKSNGEFVLRMSNGNHAAATSYDGFYVAPASGTITGTFRIYGYQNS